MNKQPPIASQTLSTSIEQEPFGAQQAPTSSKQGFGLQTGEKKAVSDRLLPTADR